MVFSISNHAISKSRFLHLLLGTNTNSVTVRNSVSDLYRTVQTNKLYKNKHLQKSCSAIHLFAHTVSDRKKKYTLYSMTTQNN